MRVVVFGLLASAFACSSNDTAPGGGGLGGAGGAAGSVTQGGSATLPSGGAAGVAGNAVAGGSGAVGAAGASSSGGTPASGSAGMANAGAMSGGGSGGGSGAGGVSASGGSGGGAGACVKNLACKLNPPPSTGDVYQDCVDRINQFLTQCACLPALKRRKDGEACADQMAKYDAEQNMAHAGIRAKICQPGGSQNECPGYSSTNQVIGLCMQQMWDEGPPPTADCTGACYEQHGHFINMTDDTVTQVACGFYTTPDGKVWAAQNFSR